MKRSLLLLIVLVALPAFARMSKYKDWPQSPEGYFMTKTERAQWATLDTDRDAEKFIADFHARRLDHFQTEIADRAEHADKFLTIGRTAGSKSMRGKVVILLGPPSRIDISEQTVKNSSHTDNGIIAGYMSNMNEADSAGGGHGSGSRDGSASNNMIATQMSTSTLVRIMHFNYQGAVPKLADRKEIDVDVVIDPTTGKDRIDSRSAESDLNSVFELVAQSWLKK